MSNDTARKRKEGLIHIAKRTELTTRLRWLLRVGTLLLALVAGGLFVLIFGIIRWLSTPQSYLALFAQEWQSRARSAL